MVSNIEFSSVSTKRKKKNKWFNSQTNIIWITVGIIILFVTVLVIFANSNRDMESNTYTLEIKGDNHIVLYVGSEYNDFGAKLYDDKKNDLSDRIIVSSDVNTSQVGRYSVTYSYRDMSIKRVVKVIDKPFNNQGGGVDNPVEEEKFTKIILNGSKTIYMDINGSYKEEGYKAIDSIDGNITKKVEITHNIDNENPGNYEIVYSVKNSSGVTTTEKRDIIVMNINLELVLKPDSYTNGNVTINAIATDEYFDYMILPDGSRYDDKNCNYTVSENGTYKFTLYNKYGAIREKEIQVNNIDRTVPIGSCSGSYKNGVSTINVSATDSSGIEKYVINGNSYSTKNISIAGEMKSVTVGIYDKASNFINVSCSLSDKNQLITSDKSITMSYEYVKPDNFMPYALFSPSTAKNIDRDLPLIVWLHGSGEVNSSQSKLLNAGMPGALTDWNLYGFNAYVVCPHLVGKYASTWYNSNSKNNLHNLLNKLTSELNIDKSKIIITGHSLGGQGALYMAQQSPNYYSAMVVFSGYHPIVDISNIKNLPSRGYVGTVAAGEDSASYSYMVNYFAKNFGEKSLYVINTGHGNLPKKVMKLDENNDGKSDVVEWMLKQ